MPNSHKNRFFRSWIVSFAMFLLSMLPVSARVIATGTLSGKEATIKVAGGYEVHEIMGKFSLVIKSDFNVTNGPDLFFVFHPLASTQITALNAKINVLKVEPGLKSIFGAQSYDLPDDFNLTHYKSLIVHCWGADHIWGVSALLPSTALSIAFSPDFTIRCYCISGRLSIRTSVAFKPVRLSIYSLEGKRVLLQQPLNIQQKDLGETWDLTGFSQGFYMVHLQDAFGKTMLGRIRVN